MSMLRLFARGLAMLWLDKRGASVEDSWLFMGDEVVYKYGVRVTIEVVNPIESEHAWLCTRGNVSISGN